MREPCRTNDGLDGELLSRRSVMRNNNTTRQAVLRTVSIGRRLEESLAGGGRKGPMPRGEAREGLIVPLGRYILYCFATVVCLEPS